MNARFRRISGHQVQSLSAGWEVTGSAPGAIDGPRPASAASLHWTAASVPSTVASTMQRAGTWSLEGPVRRFDAEDWWYRTMFAAEPCDPGDQLWLCFDGLATVADVWLNGDLLLVSEGMFTAHDVRVDTALRMENELVIRFRALDALLSARRPRPRWRAPMIENQQIRWFRSTLLGRTPGWSPPAAAVGPWRGIRLERRRGVTLDDLRLRADADGSLDVACRAWSLDGAAFGSAEIVVERAGQTFSAPLSFANRHDLLAGRLLVPDAALWWPHTHGDPALYAARILIKRDDGIVEAEIGPVGFRSVALSTARDDFAVLINGVNVFCRGACWTPLDPVSLAAAPVALERALGQVTDAGMNMLRLSGTMVYETDAFLDHCDSRGILLWQDFMFANLDYPAADAAFTELVRKEALQLLAQLQGRPSLAILCGNSEVEQQAAMWGAPREHWHAPLFHDELAALARDACPDVPYVPSSAHGGVFPHQGDVGATSYYGVGAYLRDLGDARRSGVRFASECLAFGNIPEPHTLAHLGGVRGLKVHDPAWKARTPRDLGAGWDYDDIRDHYIARLFRLDPAQLRYEDHDRYLALGRVATGEVMASVFSEWRRRRSPTRGGLVWFLRDLWPGAGWGVIDASGTPKAAWHYLRRALAPVALSLSDEGGNGIYAHVVNDRPTAVNGDLEIELYRAGEVLVARGMHPVAVAPHAGLEVNAAALFDGFLDLSYAYRFGPPSHDLIVASVRDAHGTRVAQAFHFMRGLPSTQEPDVGLAALVRPRDDGAYDLLVRTRRMAQSIRIDIEGFTVDDNYFHLAPGGERRLVLRPDAGSEASGSIGAPRGFLQPLNAEAPSQVGAASQST
ncbi:MAG TPA: hypothetical protein VHE78_03835 [Gemmatimonadaceae bacterium]|nr:hypothetical protein [Gemmatimonadaceae bacterium]